MKSRILVVFLLLSGLWIALIFRGVYLQLLPHKKLSELKNKQFLTRVRLPGRRGMILDRNGSEVAISVTTYSLFADPKIIKNIGEVSRKLSRELKIPYTHLYKKLKLENRRFVWVKRHLDKPARDRIAAWAERGLGFIEEAKRVYPNGPLLSGVLGFVGEDNRGLEGLERRYQNELAGVDQEIVLRKDARGRPLMVDMQMFSERRDGKDLQLTVDRDLQFELEKELKAAVEKHSAESAVGVIMEVGTSEIWAMANYPTFDANSHKSYASELKRNRAVTDTFEPGSTMKTILMAAALREGVITPNKKYFCEEGSFRVDNRIIKEADRKHSFGWLTASEILAHSSNIGTTKIGFDLGAEKYRQALLDFGFGEKTGIDFPGESPGILNPLPWRKHLLGNVSFGHGIAATPLQMAAAYAAIGNGGVWRTPTLFKGIKNQWGEKIDLRQNIVERQVMPRDKAAQLMLMLNAVTGTAGPVANARIAGFPVAGKTGTAQKVKKDGRGYVQGSYISSFAGLVPAHQPRFVVYIAVDNPKKQYYGAQVAAPIFSRLASFAVRRQGLAPILISENHILPERDEAKAMQKQAIQRLGVMAQPAHLVPDLRGLTLREVYRHTKDRGVTIKTHGHGVVSKTSPAPGEVLKEGQALDVYLSL